MTQPNVSRSSLSLQVREARPSDASLINDYTRLIYAESEHLITKPNEFHMGTLRRRLWIARRSANAGHICLVAMHNGKLIGMLENWTDPRARIRHSTSFGMSVHPEFQRSGVGRDILSKFIDWVAAHKTLQRIELHVHSDNQAAIALYESIGFTVEGVRKAAVHYQNKGFVDDILMAYWPNSSNVEP